MKQYIVPNIAAVNEKVEQDLLIIKTDLLKIYGDNIVAIILCGGFGRGEGSFIDEGSGPVPFNDYDLLIVTQKRISHARLAREGERLAKNLNMRFVDVGAIKKINLNKIPTTIFSFDLRSAMVIHGEQSILDLIPHFSKETLPIIEADLILYNRLICFLELTPDGFLNKQKLTDSQHKKLVLQLSKPVIAATIAWLVKEKSYETSYQKQRETFLKLNHDSETKQLVELSYKLKLGFIDPLSVDPWQYWLDSRNFFTKTFETFVRGNSSWDKFLEDHKSYKTNPVKFIKDTVKYLIYQEPIPSEARKRQAEIDVLQVILSAQLDFTANIPNWDKAKNLAVESWFKNHH